MVLPGVRYPGTGSLLLWLPWDTSARLLVRPQELRAERCSLLSLPVTPDPVSSCSPTPVWPTALLAARTWSQDTPRKS